MSLHDQQQHQPPMTLQFSHRSRGRNYVRTRTSDLNTVLKLVPIPWEEQRAADEAQMNKMK
ncbi:hypothetical protein NECAME_09027 [Necator americanus]|uniref:Uncharacterized protein n=1 Tax=Necator americanus TaxID=51031 RepID=W2TF75_NECAM|nr:hypothetical protein NECAME_09027 [Necator americanus]ETN80705.1 hypothetical protein NECAME_09027 [Necator americanus]